MIPPNSQPEKIYKTLKSRVRDKHAATLREKSVAVNYVWNYINDLSSRSIRERSRFLSEFDLHSYTKGSAKELGLHSQTVQCISKEYTTRRKQFKKAKLNWRVSNRDSSKYSLGWVPVQTGASSWKNGQVFHNGEYFKIWDSWNLSKYKFLSSSFSEDSRGRWYFNVVVEVQQEESNATGSVGIDLGLKECAVASDGSRLEGRWYRKSEEKLKIAQRAKKTKRVRAIHAKIKAQRSDALHKFSRKLVQENAAIFVGNVSSKKLIKTKMAKSTLDASWSKLKVMLGYKCRHAGIAFAEVNESFSTQTCSCCGCIPASSPKGRAGLGIREWACEDCGETHDRDINAARNILVAGHRHLAGGISGV